MNHSPLLDPLKRWRLPFRHLSESGTTPVTAPAAELIPAELASESQHRPGRVAWVLALYACIAVPLSLYLNIWIDEAYSLFTTSRELGFIIPHSRDFMLQPPAFFLVLWFWRRISMAVWFARLLPVLIIGATLWLAHRTARKWFPGFSSSWIVLPLALNPWVLYAASELRSYCLILFCATALLFFYRDAFVAERTSRVAQVLYGITAILAMNTYYYLAFLLAGGGVALLVGRRWRAVRDYSILMAVVSVVLVPQFLHAIDHAGTITDKITGLPNLARATVYASARIVSTQVDYFIFDQRHRVFWFGLVVGGVVTGVLIRWRSWTLQRSAIPIITSVIVLGYIVLTWKIAGETSFRRHFLVALVPLHFSIVAILANFGTSSARSLRVVMIALAAVGSVSSAIRYAPLAKVGDYRRVARYIESNEKRNEPIVLVASHTEIPFRYYYRGENDVLPLPEHDPLERYDIPTWALTSTGEVRDKLSAIGPQEKIWVYADRPANTVFYGVDLGYEFLEQVLAEDYTLLTEQNFYFASLRRFERKHANLDLTRAD